MKIPIPALSSSSSVPPAEVTRPVATFLQLQQLLEQSLRDLRADSSHFESVQEEELSQALQRLSGRLNHILAESTETTIPQELPGLPSSLSPGMADSGQPGYAPLHLMTTCQGVVMMANDPALNLLGIDGARLGRVSISEWISHEEWQWIRTQLQASDGSPAEVRWIIPMEFSEGIQTKMQCSLTPLLDHSRKVMMWHWDVHPHRNGVSSESLDRFVRSLEASLLNGQGLDDCLKRLCEGLVEAFGYSFTWIATVRDGQRIQLRAQAVTPDLDWDSHGRTWWSSISQQETLAQACVASERSFVSLESPHTGEFSWFPSNFPLHQAYVFPFRQGLDSGLVVMCSSVSSGIDVSIRDDWQWLGRKIGELVVRGREMEQLRLHSAIIGAVQDPMCMTDQTGRVEWVNQAYLKLLGGTPLQVLGSQLRSFPFAQLYQGQSMPGSRTSEICCVKTEIMERGKNAESLVLEQVVAPLDDAEGKPTHFMVTFHDVTARAIAEMQMKHQAYHDALTDLPNRVMFEDRLQLALAQARRDGTLLALLFLDLDNFKSINDQYGHQMGDRLLRVVAKRLVTCVRTTDTVSRLSGDEFTIILQGLDRIHDIRQVAQKIVECLMAPIQLSGKDLSVQTSIGIAVSPKDSTDPRALLAIADKAMYCAKDVGGQRWYFATPEWNFE